MMGAFRREQLLKCIHCGLCLPSCPTYLQTGNEADSPRGRIYLIRAVAEGRIEWEPAAVKHIDQCLGCRACETACPSGVAYGSLLEVARAQVERSKVRGSVQRWAKRWLLGLMADRRRFALAMRAARFGAPLLAGRALPKGIARLWGAREVALRLPEGRITMQPMRYLAGEYPATGEKRGRVGLLVGCVASVLFHEVNVATIAVLQHNGFEVVVPRGQGCCGALHLHNGYPEEAKRYAMRLIRCFEQERVDAIVVNAAGCGSTMKEYSALLDGSVAAQDARRFSARVTDVLELLDREGLRPPRYTLVGRDGVSPLVVTYHDACHLAHAQGVRAQPRRLIQSLAGVELVELTEADVCCGSAGIYNLLQPEMASALLQRKVERIRATGAEILLTANPGCLAWITQGLRPHGIQVMHPVELLCWAYRGKQK